MKAIYWLIFGWFAPFFAFLMLWAKLVFMVAMALIQLFVWCCQGALTLAGKAIQKGEERLQKNKEEKQ